MLKYINKSFIINFLIILSIFGLDRFSKAYVISINEKSLSSDLFVSKYLNINLIYNEGIAFGLLSFEENYIYQVLTTIIFIVIIILLFMIFRAKTKKYEKNGLILIAGGALGNFYDRIIYNAVPDFIDLHIGNFHWFIFNIADIFITIGVLWLIFLETISKKKVNNEI
tara:strand:- start:11 stop:514 length:504 start_codon:yes stop_codon:yes gene_type:complete